MAAKRMIITDVCDQKPAVESKFCGFVSKPAFDRYPDGSLKVKYERARQFKEAQWPWNGQGDGVYTTDISDLGQEYCPNCGGNFSMSTSEKVYKGMYGGEITHWKTLCSCGAKLTIYND